MSYVCDSCGVTVEIGMWPYCRGGHGKPYGLLSDFRERWDECIAPPPSDVFKPTGAMPDYDPRRGWRVTTFAEQKRLMRLNRVEYRD